MVVFNKEQGRKTENEMAFILDIIIVNGGFTLAIPREIHKPHVCTRTRRIPSAL